MLVNAVSLMLALDFLCLVFIGWRGRQFLKATPRLTTQQEFEAYRRLVYACMKATFGFVCLIIGAVLVGSLGLIFLVIRLDDLQTVAMIGILRVVGASFVTLGVEERLKEIPATSDWLEARNKLVQHWNRDFWPSHVDLVRRDS